MLKTGVVGMRVIVYNFEGKTEHSHVGITGVIKSIGPGVGMVRVLRDSVAKLGGNLTTSYYLSELRPQEMENV